MSLGRVWMGAGSLAITVFACVGDDSTTNDGGHDATTSDVAMNNDVTSESVTTGPINGTIIALDGSPVTGAKVEANGQVTTTDPTNGTFTLPDPGPTYSITFLYDENPLPQPLAIVYQGMTQRAPVLMMPLRFTQNSEMISGSAPGALPTGTGLQGRLAFAPKKVIGNNEAWAATVTDGGNFNAAAVDFPGKSQTGMLYFFEKTLDDAGNTTGYPIAAVTTGIGLAMGSTLPNLLFDAAAPPSTGTISGSIPNATGWTITTTKLSALLTTMGATTPVQIDQAPLTTTFSFIAPNIGEYLVDTSATNSLGATSTAWSTGVAVGTTGVALKLPTPPTVSSPAANSTIPLASTAFFFNGVEGVAMASLTCFAAGSDGGPSSANYAIHVITAATSLTAPVDPALSVALPPSGSSCTFTVGALTTIATVDAAANPGGYANAFNAQFATVNGTYAVSAPQNVTAQ